ncbi:1de2fdfa-27ad-4fe8-801b-7844a025643e [Thermothielavioides terrestris]|uniref:1de2fdfa-27ad-4fe8-801b-7844a025643e n=1 Tax=Thermothielavioides terrestris TaxID=2587410 RepID=A0A446B9X5_9PEZI|nr:1de2fdfa-27ad-4fe8-801b-7844a025643e [Thermothielavioides terrestris]
MSTTDLSPTGAAESTREKTARAVSVSEYFRERTQQWRAIYERKRPLTLLELPIDILQLIITHTNDLTQLALTNSALYSLAIPLIYARFDIVWPDGQSEATESKSVDALTYGLSTLSLGSSFARTVRRTFDPRASNLSKLADNDYASYTKKFSLGNGPREWVAEYVISKESGKMLGTLAATAITKMKNLETFVWDMPTGVPSRVFEALASLANQPDGECKLNRVWVRWHDNSDNPEQLPPVIPPSFAPHQGTQHTPVGFLLPPTASHPPPRPPVRYSEYRCEYPTFSVLPPLKSLTVLDIDEIGYLDEMAVLIERSKDCLRELRVSMSPKVRNKAWTQPWDGPGLKQIDHRARWPGESTIGDRRLGGVLGVLVGRIYDIRKRHLTKHKSTVEGSAPGDASPSSPPSTSSQTHPDVKDGAETQKPGSAGKASPDDERSNSHGPSKGSKLSRSSTARKKRLDGKLKLHTLELEGVVLSLQVCRFAIDWSVLTTLTLLNCAQHHDVFWKMLNKQFQPTPVGTVSGASPRNKSSPTGTTSLQYHLALKAIHTDRTTHALVTFIKETLAPNSLELLFLQDLLLDSSSRQTAVNNRWVHWALTTDMVQYITSGRMSNLRELAVSLEYKDWHTFLQRLPNIPQLRSINIPHMAEYPGGAFDPRELALQLVDIITLRPDIRLCYIGVGPKCFEILESTEPARTGKRGSRPNSNSAVGGASGATTPVTPAPLHAPLGTTGGLVVGGGGGGGGGNDPDVTDAFDPDESEDDEGEVGGAPAAVAGAGAGAAAGAGAGVEAHGDEGSDEEDDDDDEEEGEGEGEGVGGTNGEVQQVAVAGGHPEGNGVLMGTTPTTTTSHPEETQSEGEDDAEAAAAAAPGVTFGGTGVGFGHQQQQQQQPAVEDDEDEEEDDDDEDDEEDEDDDDDGFVEPGGIKLKLREILFYDDKVAIFRARHGKL